MYQFYRLIHFYYDIPGCWASCLKETFYHGSSHVPGCGLTSMLTHEFFLDYPMLTTQETEIQATDGILF